jgi:hypothetical protein
MNGTSSVGGSRGLPATAVLRLTGNQPVGPRRIGNAAGDEALLAAVTHPPRVGEAQPIAALMPHVLAQYGLAEAAEKSAAFDSLDVLA